MSAPAPSSRWSHRAACAGRMTPDPTLPDAAGRARQLLARDYCHGCPVIVECAADAYEHRDQGIIRAGIYIPVKDTQYRAARRVLRAIVAEPAPTPGDPS